MADTTTDAPRRAAIYARFSSDRQNERSIADQEALCREIAARDGLRIVAVFSDRAISGAAAVNRPGFQDMLRAADARAFDVLIAEDIDRLARDQGDFHAARKRLDFLGIAIHTAAGPTGRLDGSLRALMGEMYLDNLRLHVHRGMAGVVRAGRHPGGRAYGYRAVPGKPGELAIVDDEARIVREVFARYLAGERPRAIAGDLNARGIAPPRGVRWNASTINGSRSRGTGILFNALYAGRIVWNKVRMVKDPDTGRRVSRANAASAHREQAAEHLRIVDRKTFDAVQALKAARGGVRPEMQRRPVRLLSGLIKCGTCGAGMTSVSRDRKGARLQCSAHRESGTCGNGRRVYRDEVERRALAAIKEKLADRAYWRIWLDEFNAARRERLRKCGSQRATLEKKMAATQRALDRAKRALLYGDIDPATLAGEVAALEGQRRALAGEMAAMERAGDVVTLHPAAMQHYLEQIAALERALDSPPDGAAAADLAHAVRDLIARVIVHASPGRGPFTVEIHGYMSGLLSGGDDGSGGPTQPIPPEMFVILAA